MQCSYARNHPKTATCCIVAVVLLLMATTFAQHQSKKIRPTYYDIKISYEADTLYFGRSLILFDVLETTQTITFNSNETNAIIKILVQDKPGKKDVFEYKIENGSTYHVNTVIARRSKNLIIVNRKDSSNFERGNAYVIIIEFEGNVKHEVGFSRNYFYDENKKVRRYIDLTNFRPNFAQSGFPCFDDPEFKTTFALRIEINGISKKTPVALSNMLYAMIKEEDGRTSYIFPPSFSKMSTYQIAFIVSNFVYKKYSFTSSSTIAKAHVQTTFPLNIYTKTDGKMTKFAGKFVPKVMPLFVNFFGTLYPFPKLDIIAVPNFNYMESGNLGLILLKESNVLYNKNICTDVDKHRVAATISREIANSLFVNTVDMTSWNNLWFTEAFATFMMYRATQNITENLELNGIYQTDLLHPLLEWDVSLDSRPVLPVDPAIPTEERFNSMQSRKAAAILQMVETQVSTRKFQKAVRNYMKKYNDSNANPRDLFIEIDELAPGKNVLQIFDSYMLRTGYPVIYLTRYLRGFRLGQERFTMFPDITLKQQTELNAKKTTHPLPAQLANEELESMGERWNIPIAYSRETLNFVVFVNKTRWISHSPINGHYTDVKFLEIGYYRLNYDDEGWKYKINTYGSQSVELRTNLIENAFSLAKAGHLSYSYPLDLTKKLVDEKSYAPLKALSHAVDDMVVFLRNSPYEYTFKLHISKVIHNAYLVHSHSSNTTRLNHTLLLEMACKLGYYNCLETTNMQLNAFIWSKVDPDIMTNERDLMYKYGAQTLNETSWMGLLHYEIPYDTNEHMKLVQALASSLNPRLLKKLLDHVFGTQRYSNILYLTVLESMSDNFLGSSVLWEFLRGEWPRIETKITLTDSVRVIRKLSQWFSTRTKFDELKRFFKKYPKAGGGTPSRKRILEEVDYKLKMKMLWDTRCKPEVEVWLDKKAYKL